MITIKRVTLSLLVTFVALSIFGACSKDDLKVIREKKVVKHSAVAVKKDNPMQLYVHYMPWFETKETSDNGAWGMHWTMANQDPDVIVDGKRQIAAHYYPLIGPYASSDIEVIRYHLLLMKYAGVDGILIDWYGTQNANDYATNLRNTEAIVTVLEDVGIGFAIVYEDQTLNVVGEDEEARVAQAQADMKYLEEKFFGLNSYIKVGGSPLLMVFGPQNLDKPSQWSEVFGSLKKKPKLLTLYGHTSKTTNGENKNSVGEFIWVDPVDMDTKYGVKDDFELFMGGAYTGFKGFYKDGGWGDNPIPEIDHKGGALFKELLAMAQKYKVDHLQLITWNDFGEGTMIEPTVEFGYTFLTALQEFSKVSYKTEILELVYELYNLKQEVKNKDAVHKLEQAFYCLVSLKVEEAKSLINEVAKEYK